MARKHYWWRYLLFVLLGFFLGIGSVAGAVAVAGFTVTGKQVETWTGQDIFKEEYEGKNFVELFTSIANGEVDMTTLGGIAKMTPFVDQFVDSLAESLEDSLGYTLDREGLYSQKFEQLGEWLFEELKSGSKISKIMGANENSDPIVKLICFRKVGGEFDYNSSYTIGDLMDPDFFTNLKNSLVLGDVLGEIDPSDSLLNAIKGWGIEDLKNPDMINSLTLTQILGDISSDNSALYAMKDWTIGELKDGDKIYDLTIEELLGDVDPNNTVLNTIKTLSINDLKDADKIEEKINSLTIEDLLGEVDPNNSLLNAIKTWTINDLKDKDKIYDLTVSELVGEIDPNNTVLVAIKDYTINDLIDDDGLNGLTIDQLLGGVDSSNIVLYALKDLTISDLSDKSKIDAKIDALTVLDLMGTIDENNTLLQTIKDWTVADLKNPDTVNTLTVSQLMGEIDPNNAILYALKDLTLDDLKDRDAIDAQINSLTVLQLMGTIDENNTLLQTIKTWTVNDLKNPDMINTLTVEQLVGTIDPSNAILNSIKDLTIDQLKDNDALTARINTLTLSDVIDCSGNTLLSIIANSQIGNLSTDVNNITFAQLIDKDELNGNEALYNYLASYTLGNIEEAFKDMTIGALIDDDTGIFRHLDKDLPISDLSTAVKNLTILEAFEEDIFNEAEADYSTREDYLNDRTMKTIWKFMLTPSGTNLSPSGTKYVNEPAALREQYESYKIGDSMGTLVSNFSNHVENENLNSLSEAGLLDSSGNSLLTKAIGTVGYAALVNAGQGDGKSASTTYGELTVKELLTVMDVAAGYLP